MEFLNSDKTASQMLAILSASAGFGRTEGPVSENWDRVREMMSKQAVGYMPALVLSDLDLTSAQYAKFQDTCGEHLRFYYMMMDSQKKVVGILEDAGIPCVIIRGCKFMSYLLNSVNQAFTIKFVSAFSLPLAKNLHFELNLFAFPCILG